MRNGIFLKQVGNKVKALRKSRGITIRKLGEMCDMDFSNLSRFENGQKDVHILTLKHIADTLGVSVSDLL